MPEPMNTEPLSTKSSDRPQNPYANGANPFVKKTNQAEASNVAPVVPGAPGTPGAPGAPDAPVAPNMPSVPNGNGTPGHEPQNTGQEMQQPPQTPPAPVRQNASDQFDGPPVIPIFSKTVWFLAGFLMGIIGMLVVFILNVRRPKSVRNQILIYAAVGMLAGTVFNIVVLGMGGYDTGTGLIGFMTGTETGTPSGSSGGIF